MSRIARSVDPLCSLMRRSLVTSSLLIVALVVGGLQHSLRLCGNEYHARPATAQASQQQPVCPEHASPSEQPQGGQSPSCCQAAAVLVVLPSLKEAPGASAPYDAGGLSAPLPVVPPADHDVAGLHRASAGGGRRRVPFPRLRTHLVFSTLLV